MTMNRRQFLRRSAAASAIAAASSNAAAQNIITESQFTKLKWSKAPCRFCGTGCGVRVAVKGNRVVATHADANAEVNRGLNCVKGYFLSKIMYGADRLTQPLLRMTDGKYDKNGEFTPVSWDAAFDIMALKFKEALKANGPESISMFGSGQWTIWEGYAANKLMKAGFRSNNIDPNARHCMASAAEERQSRRGIGQYFLRGIRPLRQAVHVVACGEDFWLSGVVVEATRGAVRGSGSARHVVLDDGLQSAHARCLGEPSLLQPAPVRH